MKLSDCRKQSNPEKVLLFADSHDTLFQGATEMCPRPETYATAYWKHPADIIFQADGVRHYSPLCAVVITNGREVAVAQLCKASM